MCFSWIIFFSNGNIFGRSSMVVCMVGILYSIGSMIIPHKLNEEE